MKRRFYGAGLALLLLGLNACVSYQALPIDEAAILSGWHAETDSAALTKQGFKVEQGLTFKDAVGLSRWLNPELRAQRAEAGIAKVNADHAGLWDDPSLSLDGARLLESAPKQWTYGVGIDFSIPVWGTKGIEEKIATAENGVAIARVMQSEEALFYELWGNWLRFDALTKEASALEGRIGNAEALLKIAKTLNTSGQLSHADYRHLRIQRALLGDALAQLDAERGKQSMAILRLVGLTPEFPYPLTGEADSIAQWEADFALMLEREDGVPLFTHRANSELNVLRAEYAAAEERVRLQVRKQYPEIGLGPFFESDQGEESLGLGLSFSLPLFNRNIAGIDEAIAERAAKREAFIATLKGLRWQWAELEAESMRVASALTRLNEDVMPLVEEQVQELRRLAELGTLDVMLVAQTNDQRLESERAHINHQLEHQLAQLAIRKLIGPADNRDWRITGAPEEKK